jgi:hypothetical protein
MVKCIGLKRGPGNVWFFQQVQIEKSVGKKSKYKTTDLLEMFIGADHFISNDMRLA